MNEKPHRRGNLQIHFFARRDGSAVVPPLLKSDCSCAMTSLDNAAEGMRYSKMLV